MSGPKTSRYVLTAEQRRIIEEQQRIIRETKVEQDRQERLQRRCSEQLSSISEIVDELNRLCVESGVKTEALDELKSKQDEVAGIAVSTNHQETLEILKKNNRRLEVLLQEMQEAMIKGRTASREIAEKFKQKLSGEMTIGFELSFSGLGKSRRKDENPFIIKINKALEALEGVSITPDLKERLDLLRERAAKIESLDFLENFYSMQVCPFIHDCEFYRDNVDEFENLMNQYHYLTSEVGEVARYFVFSKDNIEKLREEISRLLQILMYQKEQEYISAAIDAAMVEMGYELIGERSVTKKNGRKFRNGLYSLEEGTAVNVTFSDSGQISMELGALDTEDRIPTESEATDLADDMQAFCSDYAMLEKKLMEKGITTNRVSILPPTPEYAQVFNTSDYELRRSVDIHKKEKKKTVSQKQLHREG